MYMYISKYNWLQLKLEGRWERFAILLSYISCSHPSSSAVPMVMMVPSGVAREGSLLK